MEEKLYVADILDALHRLAMLSLQSERYEFDTEFRDAVDEAIAIDRGLKAGASITLQIGRQP